MRSVICLAATAIVLASSAAASAHWPGYGVRIGAFGVRVGGFYGYHSFYRPSIAVGIGFARPYYYGGWPAYGYGYRYAPVYRAYSLPTYYAAPAPYGVCYNPSYNSVNYYLPPTYAPAELAYGPQAMKQFMGVDRNFALGPLVSSSSATPPAATVEPEKRGAALRVRETNPETRARARRLTAAGDSLFLAQKYHQAREEYRDAARLAPDVPESYFRQGHALTALGQYDLAAEAFKRGMAIDSRWAAADFDLDSIYGDSRLAKAGHLEALARAALSDDRDSDKLFLLGVFLHYDGQAERATKFFRRASELAGGDASHVAPFLPGAAPAADGRRDLFAGAVRS